MNDDYSAERTSKEYWNSFIGTYTGFQDSSSRDSKPENYIKVIDADIMVSG